MKRITTVAVAATMSLSLLTAPAYAAEAGNTGNEVSSSEAYKQCTNTFREAKKTYGDGALFMDGLNKLTGSSTPSGACIKLMAKEDEYRPGVLGTVIGVSVALVALLGVAGAAYAGLIPGVSLPAIPGLPM